ncbi:two-component system sensor histidine kinase NtrB [Pseudomaricurvus sp.]|uniref:two-component system sensor histidine kinase NtrB n=1 Tax=Pseudomaricurvus sp. TaxID=2004510 RepID=UPI003F6AD1EA
MTNAPPDHVPPAAKIPPNDINYPLLKIYAYYRVGLSFLLLLMFFSRLAPNILGEQVPELFVATSTSYAVVNILTLIILWRRRFSPNNEQIFVILFVDIVALVLLMHASGGLTSGLGFLLLVTAATGGICLNNQASTALAALSSLLVLSQALYMMQTSAGDNRSLFAAGTLGIILFACSLLFNYLSGKLRASAAEATAQAEHAAHLQRLAQLIVERMQTGIVVTDPSGSVDLINQSATQLLNWPQNGQPLRLNDMEELETRLTQWQQHRQASVPNLKPDNSNNEVRLRFADLTTEVDTDNDHSSRTLIFVEDTRSLNREAQSIKLASLGRLTASIAHEIRNPLGAISHAGQLLGESPALDKADRRLTEIIETNAQRVNQIIENVLQLSRRRPTKPEQIDLRQWLQSFISDFQENSSDHVNIDLKELNRNAHTRIDLSHLSQVMTNLIDNGLRYSQQATGDAHVTLKLGIDTTTELPFLLVIDDGDGIPEDGQSHIFEPFYTTEATGSGLGLYLSRELCEANHAAISYCRDTDGKSCFRIDFSHPDRMF